MIFTALNVSATGVQAANGYLDLVSNNVANSSTTGFKFQVPSFQDLISTGQPPGLNAPGVQQPQDTQIGLGVATTSPIGVFTQGGLTNTGQPFDLAINGNGFFQVTLADGTTGYTRAGDFTTNTDGQLVTAEGFVLSPGITIPSDATSFSVGTDGTVTAQTAAGTVTLGQITLTNFQNPSGLLRVGDTAFAATGSSGTATTAAPGTSGLGQLSQGFLENSNVDLSTELVNLLVAQRTFQVNTQALTVENEMLTDTAALFT